MNDEVIGLDEIAFSFSETRIFPCLIFHIHNWIEYKSLKMKRMDQFSARLPLAKAVSFINYLDGYSSRHVTITRTIELRMKIGKTCFGKIGSNMFSDFQCFVVFLKIVSFYYSGYFAQFMLALIIEEQYLKNVKLSIVPTNI